ncbi:RNA-directed DNA polymerase [Siculibacillus lacustris]|uniref:RNA-directed DNA polymerase n=1 Tax=Siculibacillus lacustris TaxID=1549641 RepID=A0A4Q9VDZ7_9HYPH|nr:reverse transcriptase family protein [Siculibacillus lacustris]TBW32842.1 RNA-directed DNA polymerase [Siculibacillus lacustris]
MNPNMGYTERESPFFRLNSKNKLAKLLFIGLPKLKELAAGADLYYSFQKVKKSGGMRMISAPRDDLKKVQKRISDLLQRIAPPDFLFAPVKGRSYVDNAAVHIGATAVHLLDIEDFFPSCTANKVIWFFKTRFECSPDIAVILKNIATRNGSLPQGSPCSPALAYFCYVDMWKEIEAHVKQRGCKLSVYADDLTISGDVVPGELVFDIKATMLRHGHQYSAKKERSKIMKPVEITGVIVANNQLLIPNRQHRSIVIAQRKLGKEKKLRERLKITNELKGRNAQKNQIKNHPGQPTTDAIPTPTGYYQSTTRSTSSSVTSSDRRS